jgi:hypothetical protein
MHQFRYWLAALWWAKFRVVRPTQRGLWLARWVAGFSVFCRSSVRGADASGVDPNIHDNGRHIGWAFSLNLNRGSGRRFRHWNRNARHLFAPGGAPQASPHRQMARDVCTVCARENLEDPNFRLSA